MRSFKYPVNSLLKKKDAARCLGKIVGTEGDYYLVEWEDMDLKARSVNWPMESVDKCYYLDIEESFDLYLK